MRHVSLLLLVSYLIKLMISGASVSDAIIIAALSALYSICNYIESKKEPKANQDLINKIQELENKLDSTTKKVDTLSFAPIFKKA